MPGRVRVAGGGKLRTAGVFADDACVVLLAAEDVMAALGERARVGVLLTVLESLVLPAE